MPTKGTTAPQLGSIFWVVFEHLYYLPGKAAPEKEYRVCKAVAKEVFNSGKEMRYDYFDPDGFRRVGYIYVNKIGTAHSGVYLTRQEAVQEAIVRTGREEKYRPGEHLRRPWEFADGRAPTEEVKNEH